MKTIAYKSGYKYQLENDYIHNSTGIIPEKDIDIHYVKLNTDGDLFIKAGYAWDGPSGPAIDTKNFMRGSLVHDAFYQLMREDLISRYKYRDTADRLLQSICREDGMSKVRASWVYYGVKWFAKSAAGTENKKAVIYAPENPPDQQHA